MKTKIRIDQLTSVRFFAALMIVIHHWQDVLGRSTNGFAWAQGVSFFFVLSGFILTYVYPELNNAKEILQFWRARIARIWPAYIASFLLGWWLIPSTWAWDPRTFVANLLMFQAWIPISKYFFSYNSVCWSVSTEFFFYIAFPFLLHKWKRTWAIKLAISAVMVVVLVLVANIFSLPPYGDPSETRGFVISDMGLLYINPLARVFEFILGMVTATGFKKFGHYSINKAQASLFEVGVLLLCAITVYYSQTFAASCKPYCGSGVIWLTWSGSAFAFALLIYVIAKGKGVISNILSNPVMVFLGEISYSGYLLHRIFILYYTLNISKFANLPIQYVFVIYSVVVLLFSYLLWKFLEVPARQLIVGQIQGGRFSAMMSFPKGVIR